MLEIAKRSGGSTTIESNTGFTVAANTSYWTRLNVNHSGSSTVVSVKIWQDGTNEPAGWTLTWTDTTPLAAGYMGAGGSWNQTGTGESISYACYAYSATPATPAAACGEGKYTYNAVYDSLLRATDLKWTRASDGVTRYDVQPSYDAVSNVTGVKTTLPQGTDTQAFCYDEQNRLIWAGSTGTPSCGASLTAGTLTAAQYSASYSYDTLDRLTASPLGSYTYGDSAHLHAATAIGPSGGTATWTTNYDASGNTACRAATTATTCAGTTPTGALLTYDNEGRLTAWQNLTNVTTTPTSTPGLEEALYDGEGQRVQQIDESNTTKTTTQHTYVGGSEDLASQWANTGGAVTTTTTAYYGSGLAQSVNGALSYTLSDGLGSVSASVNASGTASASQLYGPYGAVRYQNGTPPTDYGFTHQRADATSGLDYYGARYYDPVAGQFTSADSVQAGGLNRYAYVGGNPETKTDPSGHCPNCIGALIGAGVGAGLAIAFTVATHQGDWTTDDYLGLAANALLGAGLGAMAGATLGAGIGAAIATYGATASMGAAATAGATGAGMYIAYGVAPEFNDATTQSAKDLQEIDAARQKYSVTSTRRNAAFMDVEIDGKSPQHMASFSGSSPEGTAPQVGENPRYQATVDGYLRNRDTEYKLWNWLDSQVSDSDSGKVTLVTEHDFCNSCRPFGAQFQADHPNIQVTQRWAGRMW